MTVNSTVGSARRSGVPSILQRYPLTAFFILAFGCTWPFLIADALGARGLIPFRMDLHGPGIALVLLMSYGPTIAALIMTSVTQGSGGMRALRRRLLTWRVGLRWYAVVLAGPALVYFGTSKIHVLMGGTPQPLPAYGWQLILIATLGTVVRGLANGEEIGWRGYALPQLQARYSAFHASLILGVIWAAFHLPLFFTLGGGVGGSQSGADALAFLVGIVAVSTLFTWIANNTGGSLLLLILLHGALNTWPDLFRTVGGRPGQAWIEPAVLWIIVLLVVRYTGSDRLVRETSANGECHPT